MAPIEANLMMKEEYRIPMKIADEFVPVGAPPGLDMDLTPKKVEIGTFKTEKKFAATKLSLAELMEAPADTKTVDLGFAGPPPGLEALLSEDEDLAPPPGLATPTTESGDESDDTRPSESDRLGKEPKRKVSIAVKEPSAKVTLSLGDLMVVERNELKASAPLFMPILSADAATILMNEVLEASPAEVAEAATQRTPLRTKLSSKSAAYAPFVPVADEYPFVSTSTVQDAWQKWDTQHGYCGQSEYYSEFDGVSSWDTSMGNYSEYDGTSSYENAEQWYGETA